MISLCVFNRDPVDTIPMGVMVYHSDGISMTPMLIKAGFVPKQ